MPWLTLSSPGEIRLAPASIESTAPMQSCRSHSEKATAIRRGLGAPGAGMDAGALAVAVGSLLDEAGVLDADRLYARARELRDELDVAGVVERERRRREQRSFRLHRQSDGMTRAVWLMDPETAAIVTDVVDRATSPKLGGPRFVRSDEAERAARIEQDPRTAEQYASDVLVELLRLGHTADPHLLGGDEPPAVRVRWSPARRCLPSLRGLAVSRPELLEQLPAKVRAMRDARGSAGLLRRPPRQPRRRPLRLAGCQPAP